MLEYIEPLCLLDTITDGEMSENDMAFYCRQILLILEDLHKRNIVHRDIK